jgi:CRP-like cAMP-binding protein
VNEAEKQRLLTEQHAERERALAGIDFLQPLPKPALSQLAALAETKLYAAGELIIRQGEPGNQLFVILRGEAAVVLERADGKQREVARLLAGKFFGEMSLMTGEPRTATVRAVRECELVLVDKPAFQQILLKNANVLEQVSGVLSSRHQKLDEHTTLLNGRLTAPPEEPNILLGRIKRFFAL